MLNLARVFVDPKVILFAILHHVKIVVGAIPVGIDIGNEVSLGTPLLDAL